jgi:uncharacterized protein with GYD domain
MNTDNEAKYLIFISSTYRDLEEERSRVIKTILRAGQFPIAMENFVASDKEQWDTIEKLLKKAGCMILIIGTNYGTIEEESGFSYTEKEYNFANEKQIPILSFIKRVEDSEWKNIKSKNKSKLKAFRRKVETSGRTVTYFNDMTDLVDKIAASIYNGITKFINPWYCLTKQDSIISRESDLSLTDVSKVGKGNRSLMELMVQNYWNDEAITMYDKYKDELEKLDNKWERFMLWKGDRNFKNLFEVRDDSNMITEEMRNDGIVKSIRYVWTDEVNQMWVMGWYLKK